MTIHKILQGDVKEVQKTLPDSSINLIVTSPPYYAYKAYSTSPDDIENSETYDQYIQSLDIIIKDWYRILAPNGRCCVVIDDKHTNLKTEGINKNRGTHARIILMAEKHGLTYKDIVIWAKARAGHASGGAMYMLGSFPYPPNIPMVNWFEYILIFQKPGKRIIPKDKIKSKLSIEEFAWASQSIWQINNHTPYDHPAPFCEEIPYRLIKLFSFKEDIVLDPFLGSGTTSVVAKKLGRNSIGIELNPTYVKMAQDRLNRVIGSEQTITRIQNVSEI